MRPLPLILIIVAAILISASPAFFPSCNPELKSEADGTTTTPDAAVVLDTKPVKTCPVTSMGHSVYEFRCLDGSHLPIELGEFLTEHPALAVQAVSPYFDNSRAHGYVVVTRNK